MACTVTTFRIRFPEFSDDTEYPDARIQLFIDDSVLWIGSDENRWCGKYDLAHCYLTAHLLTSATQTEVGDSASKLGAINNKSAGGVSVGRATGDKGRTDQDDFYASTAYGVQFLSVRNTCCSGVMVANEL